MHLCILYINSDQTAMIT